MKSFKGSDYYSPFFQIINQPALVQEFILFNKLENKMKKDLKLTALTKSEMKDAFGGQKVKCMCFHLHDPITGEHIMDSTYATTEGVTFPPLP